MLKKYHFFLEIKKSHELEKKSLEDLLYEKQESLEVRQSQFPPPAKKIILKVWGLYGLGMFLCTFVVFLVSAC